jgi:hypothetical protein
MSAARSKEIPSQQPAQPWPKRRGQASRLLASDHREIARRQAREARIYEKNGRRRPKP